MPIKYDNLGVLLAKKGLKKTDLLEVISSKTLAKISKNEVLTTETIEKICLFLNCQPNDIMEVYKVEEAFNGFDFQKKIYLPNADGTYTALQKKLFRTMVKESLITEEKIQEWMSDEIFRRGYETK